MVGTFDKHHLRKNNEKRQENDLHEVLRLQDF